MAGSPQSLHALILAGRRRGRDPVADFAGISHKALLELAGKTMLARVYEAVAALPNIAHIFLAIDEPAAIDRIPALAVARDQGRLRLLPTAESPVASVALAIDRIGLEAPLLVTTADHPLLSAAMIAHFLDRAPAEADFSLALARKDVIERVFAGRRTYHYFGGIGYSGCNLFLIRRPQALRLLDFWRSLEAYRKKSWRLIVRAIGLWPLIKMRCGWLDLKGALAHLGRLSETRIAAVDMPFAEAAFDVDKIEDIALVDARLRALEKIDETRNPL